MRRIVTIGIAWSLVAAPVMLLAEAADGSREAREQRLRERAEAGAVSAKERVLAMLRDAEGRAGKVQQPVALPPPVEPVSEPVPQAQRRADEVIRSLVDEVESLRVEGALERASLQARRTSETALKIESQTVYTYVPGRIYEIRTAVDRVTDIELQPGEVLTGRPVAGDSVRWKISNVSSGHGSKQVQHLILKPIDHGIETNIIVTTNRRNYHLRAIAGNTYAPSVRWEYGDDFSEEEQDASRVSRDQVDELGVAPQNLRFEYQVSGQNYGWKPVRVFDDGRKTFIQMPPSLSVTEAPALFVIDEEGEPALVNYRVRNGYYIVDRLFEEAELRVGKERAVRIVRAFGEQPARESKRFFAWE